jgi:hypothetical protein
MGNFYFTEAVYGQQKFGRQLRYKSRSARRSCEKGGALDCQATFDQKGTLPSAAFLPLLLRTIRSITRPVITTGLVLCGLNWPYFYIDIMLVL